MDSIVVKVSDLFNMAKSLSDDGMTYVKLQLFDSDGELPASINFQAIDSLDESAPSIEYEDIDSADINI